MRALIRRLTIFVIVLLGTPLLYFIGWCLNGHEDSMSILKALLKISWDGQDA